MGAVRYKDIEGNKAQEIRANGTYDKIELSRLFKWAADGSEAEAGR